MHHIFSQQLDSHLSHGDKTPTLYFPAVTTAGLLSSITQLYTVPFGYHGNHRGLYKWAWGTITPLLSCSNSVILLVVIRCAGYWCAVPIPEDLHSQALMYDLIRYGNWFMKEALLTVNGIFITRTDYKVYLPAFCLIQSQVLAEIHAARINWKWRGKKRLIKERDTFVLGFVTVKAWDKFSKCSTPKWPKRCLWKF